jgi:glycosyltransferase involved in cell wall biosynthesis
MFSIIIPLYNKAAYIEKAINSVLAQTFKEFELIIVNDGSTDDSFAKLTVICNQLSVENPEIFNKIKIVQQENQGVSTARNNGVKIAKYDYIAFLDADDWWESTFLEEIKNLIEEYPDSGIFGSSYFKVKNGIYITANIGVEKEFKKGIINYFKVYTKTLWMPLWTGAIIIPKAIFQSVSGFKPQLKLGEDFDLWVRIVTKYSVAFINKPLSNYNQDVELANRAIGEKFYKPLQHMLFTDYGELNYNSDFRKLFEDLAVYGLLPYYLAGKNTNEVNIILSEINWKNHAFKYQLYYKYLPKTVVKFWFKALKLASKCKSLLIKHV